MPLLLTLSHVCFTAGGAKTQGHTDCQWERAKVSGFGERRSAGQSVKWLESGGPTSVADPVGLVACW